MVRNQVDHARDGAGAVGRRTPSLDHLDAVDQARRQLLDAVDHRQRRKRRPAVDQELGVRPLEPQQPDLRGVAGLARRLHAHAAGPLNGVGQGPGGRALDPGARHRLHMERHVRQPLFCPRRADHDLRTEGGPKLDIELNRLPFLDPESLFGESVTLRVDHQPVFARGHRVEAEPTIHRRHRRGGRRGQGHRGAGYGLSGKRPHRALNPFVGRTHRRHRLPGCQKQQRSGRHDGSAARHKLSNLRPFHGRESYF